LTHLFCSVAEADDNAELWLEAAYGFLLEAA
jgi:hypothetical protein